MPTDIRFDSRLIYKDSYLLHVGSCRGRRMTAFMHIGDSEDDLAIINDSYPRRQFEEIALLHHIREEDTTFQDVVCVLTAGDSGSRGGNPTVIPRPTGPDRVDRWWKKRLVIGNRGSRLTAAKSVRDILMGVYDVTEGTRFLLFSTFSPEPDTLSFIAHRALVNQKHYLHLDISPFNFLIYPQDNKGSIETKKLIENSPKFIKSILGIPW